VWTRPLDVTRQREAPARYSECGHAHSTGLARGKHRRGVASVDRPILGSTVRRRRPAVRAGRSHSSQRRRRRLGLRTMSPVLLLSSGLQVLVSRRLETISGRPLSWSREDGIAYISDPRHPRPHHPRLCALVTATTTLGEP